MAAQSRTLHEADGKDDTLSGPIIYADMRVPEFVARLQQGFRDDQSLLSRADAAVQVAVVFLYHDRDAEEQARALGAARVTWSLALELVATHPEWMAAMAQAYVAACDSPPRIARPIAEAQIIVNAVPLSDSDDARR